MPKKIHKLEYLPDYNFIVIGITSDEMDYKLIWEINKALAWNLERKENYKFYNKITKAEYDFPLFTYTDEDSYIHYKLVSNKHNGFTLLDELKNLDYLLLVYDETGSDHLGFISEKLRETKAVRGVF